MSNHTSSNQSHEEYVKSELVAAGISQFSMRRFTSSYLHHVIHPDEHIKAAMFGRRKGEPGGIFGFEEGLLVATDRRVVYIIHRPGYTKMDEISYDVVSGVELSVAGLYASVTLFTKLTNYTLSFARPKSARKFADFIEERTLDTKPS